MYYLLMVGPIPVRCLAPQGKQTTAVVVVVEVL